MRHTGQRMTTASIDNLTFKRRLSGDIVVLTPDTLWKHLREVRVDSYVEDQEGFRRAMNRAFITYVSISPEGKPVEIPYGLEVQNFVEEARWDGALLRRENRKSRTKIGY